MKPKLVTEMKVSDAFKNATPNVIVTKSAFISVCAEIDRDFRVDCNISISEKCTQEKFDIALKKIPTLNKMTYELFKEYVKFYQDVRNIVAHLYARDKIKASENLIRYFSNIVKPQKSVLMEGEITIYGMAYLLTFIAKRSHAWSLFTNLFKKEYFADVKSNTGQEMFVHLKSFTMPGKAKYSNENIKEIDVIHLNAVILKNVTNIVFEIEKAALNNSLRSYGRSINFLDEINSLKEVKNQSEIRTLRNAFFHGYYLFDIFEAPFAGKTKITFEFIVNVLNALKDSAINIEKYKFLVKSIENFGMELLHYFFVSMIEVSYKIVDVRLLTAEKLESRISRANLLFQKIDYYSNIYLPYTCKLIPEGEIKISLQKMKFTHICKRETITNNFSVIRLRSSKGFDIGDYHTNVKEFYLVKVDLPKKFTNKINNQYIDDVKVKKIKNFCRIISLYSADI